MPIKKTGGKFFPVLFLGNEDSPSRSHYCVLIRITTTPVFPLFSLSMGLLSYIYCHLLLLVFFFFASAYSLFSQLSCGQFGITMYYFQAAFWMLLAMPSLLCFPMDLIFATGETFCPQKSKSV